MDRARVQERAALAMGGTLIAIAIAITGCAPIRTTAGDIYSATHMQPLGIDPSSSVAADVAKAEKTRGKVPSFRSVPPKPTDIPVASTYKSKVVDVVGDRRQLSRWEKAHPQEASDTEGYASLQRGKFAGMVAPPPAQDANAEAFASKLREAAEAPPRKASPKPAEKPVEDSPSKTAPSAY